MNTQTKYTRGPWIIGDEYENNNFNVYDQEAGDIVAEARNEGDAHLIAAAPEMLEQLRHCLKDAEMALSNEWDRSDEGFVAMRDNIKGVIAMAENRGLY